MKYSQGDMYCYDGTDVLKNIPELTTQDDLDAFEEEHSALRMFHVPTGNFDAAHLQAIHQHMFQDVYAWAGEYRNCSISKGTSQFCQPQFIEQEVTKLCTWVQKSLEASPLTREKAVATLTHVISELNACHPFREGNGRTLREFASQLANRMGFYLDIPHLQKGWLEASIASFNGNNSLLQRLLGDAMQEM